MEVVEVAPPYDHADITSVLASRIINDVLGILVEERKLGRPPREEPAAPEQPTA
jgi:agmatinase